MTPAHIPPPPISTSLFTVFCRQADGQGTTHIDTLRSPDLESAILVGREQCLRDLSCGAGGSLSLDDIHCLGVAAGDIEILHWEDPSE